MNFYVRTYGNNLFLSIYLIILSPTCEDLCFCLNVSLVCAKHWSFIMSCYLLLVQRLWSWCVYWRKNYDLLLLQECVEVFWLSFSFDFTFFTREHDLVPCSIYFMDFVSLQIFYGMYVGSMSAFLDQFDPLY